MVVMMQTQSPSCTGKQEPHPAYLLYVCGPMLAPLQSALGEAHMESETQTHKGDTAQVEVAWEAWMHTHVCLSEDGMQQWAWRRGMSRRGHHRRGPPV